MSNRLGIDVGGTFTDVVLVGDDVSVRRKVRSTPDDPGRGVLDACAAIAEAIEADVGSVLASLDHFGLGTTVVTNILATGSGRRVGLLTTAGFEDLVPLARGNRVCDGGWLVLPPTLVERACIVGLDERTDRNGDIARAVDVDAAVDAARRLVDEDGCEAIVVSLLWSFRNPTNEHAVRDALVAALPGTAVVLGSDLAPVIREYERTQFALLNAVIGDALDWLVPLETDLRRLGLGAAIVLTHSSGGAVTVRGAREVPIGLAQSGPAAGAAASAALAQRRGDGRVVACDLGGTSLDVALVGDGEVLRRTRGRVVGHWTALSMVDVDSVGAGGGSVAWADPVGGIRVGPQSAGAAPGPACYGNGGTAATLTDALVVLGYVDPTTFLGGRMPLDAGAALDACARLGAAVGLDALETAWGIREVALVNMVRAVRTRIASRGLDAVDLTLYAIGGCGGLFGGDIAAGAGARTAVVPELASVFSAFGAATAALRRERARSVVVRVAAGLDHLRGALRELADEVRAELRGDGLTDDAIDVRYEADMRFERQGSEVTVPLTVDAHGEPTFDGVEQRFTAEYVRRFGAGAVSMGVAVELMTLRAVGTARSGEPSHVVAPAHRRAAPADDERVVRTARGAASTVPVRVATQLDVGHEMAGPSLVDAGDTTVWIPDRWIAHVDATRSLVLEVQP